jgi:hypothetical protein
MCELYAFAGKTKRLVLEIPLHHVKPGRSPMESHLLGIEAAE